MKCQILFSGKVKEKVNLLSDELAQSMVKVKTHQEYKKKVRETDQFGLPYSKHHLVTGK